MYLSPKQAERKKVFRLSFSLTSDDWLVSARSSALTR